jgi:hypothetical protein
MAFGWSQCCIAATGEVEDKVLDKVRGHQKKEGPDFFSPAP